MSLSKDTDDSVGQNVERGAGDCATADICDSGDDVIFEDACESADSGEEYSECNEAEEGTEKAEEVLHPAAEEDEPASKVAAVDDDRTTMTSPDKCPSSDSGVSEQSDLVCILNNLF